MYASGLFSSICPSPSRRNAAWLCEFFGRTRATNDLLPHLITWLNDRDWQLRAAFFEHIVGAAVFLGPMPANQVCALVGQIGRSMPSKEAHKFIMLRIGGIVLLDVNKKLFQRVLSHHT
jgi:hypothetical protein